MKEQSQKAIKATREEHFTTSPLWFRSVYQGIKGGAMDILMMVLIVLALLSVVIAGVVHRAYSRSQDRLQELTAKVSGLDANLEDR